MRSLATPKIGHGSTLHPARRIPTVCVVDPQAADYQDWRKSAEPSGVRLEIVASAEEALRLSRTQAVDLWVINTALAGRSGFELCSMLKAQSPQAVVYLVTDHYTPDVERRALMARATMFGCKGEHTGWLDAWLETVRRPSGHGSWPNLKSEI